MTPTGHPSEVVTFDVRTLGCPYAVLEVKRRTASLPAGTRVEVLCADAWAALDVEVWARRAGHTVERPGPSTVLLAIGHPARR